MANIVDAHSSDCSLKEETFESTLKFQKIQITEKTAVITLKFEQCNFTIQ